MPSVLILEDEFLYSNRIVPFVKQEIPKAQISILTAVPETMEILPDLAILDIALEGEKDGIDFMKKYGERIPAILFYSQCRGRMKDSFGPNVIGFLEKDEDEKILRDKLRQAKRILEKKPVVWLFDEYRRSVPVRIDQICSISRKDRIFWFEDMSGKQYRTKSGKLEDKLSDNRKWIDESFVWINQSELVNIERIETIDGAKVNLVNGTSFYISRRFRASFLRRIAL